ncbi:MAG: LysR family transcriptional regulator [Gemmataceae bacterium]|nr:LysR family transcriptional regulator [Gemmataceae bacterium]
MAGFVSVSRKKWYTDRMESLNYHHLYYFWHVGRESSVARACERIGVSQPTISSQISLLEQSLGEKLFVRSGRNLVLSDAGKLVFGYADQIFNTGREMQLALRGRVAGPRERLVVGIVDILPKTLVGKILSPLLGQPDSPLLVCQEDKPDRLVAELAQHNLDLVLTDALPGHGVKARAHGHLLGESAISFFASPKIADHLKGPFPDCLDGAPMLMPVRNSTMWRTLDDWFESIKVVPRVVGEFADSALMKAFGQKGVGIFPAPQVVESDVTDQFGVRSVGTAPRIRDRIYCLTINRTPKDAAILKLIESARTRIFGQPVPQTD